MPDANRAVAPRRGSTLRLASKRADAQDGSRRGTLAQSPSEKPPAAPLVPDIVEVRIRLDAEEGLVEARRQARELAARGGFRVLDRAIIAAIVSELGRNMLLYASSGEIAVRLVEDKQRVGLSISASDSGPGIADLTRAMRDGYSTSGRPGLGLPGVRRLADEFEIWSSQSEGTKVVTRKWRN